MAKDSEQQPPRVSRLLPLTLLAVLLAGFVGAIFNPALLRSPEGNLVDGTWASNYQDAFGEEHLFLKPARAAWNAFDLALFGQGPVGVLSGPDGWLFTTEEFAHAQQPEVIRQAWLAEITSAGEQLASRGVPLLVAIVPTKAGSLPDLAQPLPQAGANRYGATLTDLAEAGIATVDLREILDGEEFWLRTDTHWTPRGADRAASFIAMAMQELVTDLPLSSHDFAVDSSETTLFRGDLDRLLALGPFSNAGPAAEQITVHTVARTGEPAGGLFDDVAVDAVLIGTSYSAASEWNLADRLRLELGIDILDLAEAGRGPLAPMNEFLASEALENSPPLLVVWEIPERYLTDTAFLEELP